MELRPADLGDSLAVTIVEARSATYRASRNFGRTPLALPTPRSDFSKPVGAFGRFITRGSGLSGESQARAAAAAGPLTQGMLIGSIASSASFLMPMGIVLSQGEFGLATLFGTMLLLMNGFFVGFPLTLARKWMTSPLSQEELTHLIVAREGNALENAYLKLVKEVLQQTNIPVEAQDGLREALRSLSEAIARLPSFTATPQSSAGELRRNAIAVQARADAESDPVTQASLARQADAIERSAQAAERSSVLIKRTTALREELAAQIEALRLGLTAFYSGNSDVSGLSNLSEHVRTVAAEAISVSEARNELDSISHYTTPIVQAERTVTLRR